MQQQPRVNSTTNPKYEAIPVENNKGYVLSYKSTWGIGFYKYTGSTLAANRAWLPKEMVSQNNQDNKFLKTGIIKDPESPECIFDRWNQNR